MSLYEITSKLEMAGNNIDSLKGEYDLIKMEEERLKEECEQ